MLQSTFINLRHRVIGFGFAFSPSVDSNNSLGYIFLSNSCIYFKSKFNIKSYIYF